MLPPEELLIPMSSNITLFLLYQLLLCILECSQTQQKTNMCKEPRSQVSNYTDLQRYLSVRLRGFLFVGLPNLFTRHAKTLYSFTEKLCTHGYDMVRETQRSVWRNCLKMASEWLMLEKRTTAFMHSFVMQYVQLVDDMSEEECTSHVNCLITGL